MNKPILPDESVIIGHQAAEIAANALEDLGRAMIRQKSLDIARQIEIYLENRDFSTLEEIQNDPRLASIAVTRIAGSGYSAVHDTRGINIFHANPLILHKDLHVSAFVFPQFWDIIERSLTREVDGYYDWLEPDGSVHRKYMYCVPLFPRQIAPLGLVVATTISIDEFLQPSREIHARIITLAERVDEFTRIEQRRNSQLRAINEFSRKISSFLTAEDLLPYVATTLHKTFQLQSVRIYLLAGKLRNVKLAAQSGTLPCLVNGEAPEVLKQSAIEMVASTGKPFLSNEGTAIEPDQERGLSCEPVRMVVPIKIGKNILGVLDLIDSNVEPFADVDLFTIWPLADQVAIALENARLHSELREMAVVEERNRIA
ncbi:MAG: GAF domain-containing protein, partial [Chloroflexi bacterium]|nr:GAF domain-containing protein [Chloroflexota bacterium]